MTRRRAAVTGVVLVALASVGVWTQRRTLAEGALANELARRGVPARYRVAEIGFRWQRIEDVRLGDSKAPDLTADWAEIRIAADLGGVHATAIRAGGVRLRGRLIGNVMSWGSLDRLLPKATGAPFALPDLEVDLADARAAIATEYGAIGARLDGRGNLRDGFAGKLALIAPALAVGTCTASGTSAYVDLSVRARRPKIAGPVRVTSANCGGVTLGKSASALDVALTDALDGWQGSAKLDLGDVKASSLRLAGLTGAIGFTGTRGATTGTARLIAPTGAVGRVRLGGMAFDGKFGLRGAISEGQGTVRVARVVPDSVVSRQITSLARGAQGTPVGPLLGQLAKAVSSAGAGVSASADIAAQVRPSGASAIVTRADARANTGARFTLSGGEGVRFGAVGLLADSNITLAGGGFPSINASFRRTANGETRGIARIAPYAADRARLTLTPLAFAASPRGAIRITTQASLDGPIGSGQVTALRAPIDVTLDARGGVAIGAGCTPISFAALRVSGLRLDPARLRLCPAAGALLRYAGGRLSGGGVLQAARLSGALGSSPLTLAASEARIALGDNGFALTKLAARIGAGDRITAIDIGALGGRIGAEGLSGTFTGLSGQIARVPLLVAGGAGRWTFARGALDLGGTASVSDAATPVRFNTLTADAVRLRLADNRIAMTGVLREPKSGALVSNLRVAHDLGRGVGSARLDVPDLRFGKTLQPEMLTPLTLGVIANLEGALSGHGDIAWTPDGLTSSGRFATKGFDLAAAFGPVAGLKGEIVFTDLLGLVTAPGQFATVDSVNPGIPVLGGVVRYHLAEGQKIVVEGGRWPFAGGALVLDPAVLDMGETRERRLTFRVEGLDAAKFIEQLEFDDLAATGLFDGSIPMIFDATGGRIEGGRIVARKPGGTLAYVGEVSNAQLNVFAKLAFDALKSIRYNNLAIGLDGPLDGEMISRVDFTGINEAPKAAKKSFIARQFSNLPFKFNITIRAPFRGLLSTARTFQDPGALLRQLPPLPPPIQPSESEKQP